MAEQIVNEAGSTLEVADECNAASPVDVELLATLTSDQIEAFEKLAASDLGMLVAPPGSGKPVVGCALIAHHQVATLVMVDRKPLVDQWRERLVNHLKLDPKRIGQLGGGRSKTKGIVDIVMVQSLARRDDVAELTASYGLVIVDECHHVPAVTFERAVGEIPVRKWVGLTATPYRRDGLQAMMGMHCGPVRHTMSSPAEADRHSLKLIVHETTHESTENGQHIQTTFRELVEDDERTAAICSDIATASVSGRNCLVLTRWTEHLDLITKSLQARGVNVLVLHGQMGKKARTAVLQKLGKPSEQRHGLVWPQPPACWGRDSTVRRSTPCSWRFRSGSRGAWCSTSVVSFVRPPTRRAWRSTTTWTRWCQSSPACTMNVEGPMRRSDLTCPRAEGPANPESVANADEIPALM